MITSYPTLSARFHSRQERLFKFKDGHVPPGVLRSRSKLEMQREEARARAAEADDDPEPRMLDILIPGLQMRETYLN